MKILIVDDDPIVIQSCRRILEAEGHTVLTAGTVADGEKQLDLQAFDLMVTDIKMPGQDGFEMIRRAGKLRPGMPVLVMTGYLMPETEGEIRRLGVGTHIAKPFTPAEFLAAVEGFQRH
jgi:DNA-binding response OmpR family regulator